MSELDPRIRFHITQRSSPGWHEPARLLYDCELVHVLEGEFQLRIEDREFTMRKGAVAIIGPQINHESWVLPHQSVIRQCLHFDWNPISSHIASPLFTLASGEYDELCLHPVDPEFECCLRLMSPPRYNKPIIPVITDLFERLDRNDPIGETLMFSVLKFFLQKYDAASPRRAGSSKSERIIMELKHYIDTNYREPLTSEDFCQFSRLSHSHLCQAFSASIGMPPNKYLNQVRLEHASRLLLSSKMTVSEIAAEVGFYDNNYFARFFKKEKGMSPTHFIKANTG